MAVALNVDIFDKDGRVLVRHIFFGETEDEAETFREHHLQACSYFRKAEQEGRVGQFAETISDDDVPDAEDYTEEIEEEEP